MSDRAGANRIQMMWILMVGFLVTALGATAVGLVISPDRTDSNLNEWVIIGVIVLVVAGALGALRGRWFTKVPQDAALGVSTGVILRIALAEVVWLLGFIFFMLGRVPTRGELIRHSSGIEFEVMGADPRRVRKLKIHTRGKSAGTTRKQPVAAGEGQG